MKDNKKQNEKEPLDQQLIEEFLRISQQLINNSKPLPPDFAKVLEDNYWDLLEAEEDDLF